MLFSKSKALGVRDIKQAGFKVNMKKARIAREILKKTNEGKLVLLTR